MLDETGMRNLWQQINDLWVQPEINRRREEGILPSDFKIEHCLIRLPLDLPPIVEFNSEVKLVARVKLADNTTDRRVGQEIFLHEVERIEKVLPPKVNDARVAFMFLYWDGQAYGIVFDFSPNLPDFAEDNEFELGDHIAKILEQGLVNSVVRMSTSSQFQLAQIGLWPATSLLPYPIALIVEQVGAGETDKARETLVRHCSGIFIEDLTRTWQPIPEFKIRQDVFEEAVFAHNTEKHRLSIYTLIPQIEGVIADWLHRNFPAEQVKYSVGSRVEQWRDAINSISDLDITYRNVLLGVANFMLDASSGPLQDFKNWLDHVDPAFPSRHAVSHGKYIPDLFTEENSIKLFLLLDTICQFMMFYDAQGTNSGN